MKKHPGILSAGLALLALVLASGCVTTVLPTDNGPFFAPTNFSGEPFLGGVRRVVLLPVNGGAAATEESAAAFDEVMRTALQRQNRFEVVVLSRAECLRRFRSESLSSAGALPRDLLPVLKKEFVADAVMFVDLTVYKAYRPIELGLRAKLASIDGARLIWTFDTIFSASDPAVANSARRHFRAAPTGVPADLTAAVLQSPTRFGQYAAGAMFDTLPPVTEPIVIGGAVAK